MRASFSAGLGSVLIFLSVLACSSPTKPTVQENEAVRHGRQVFLALSCPACHGHDRKGTNIGPPIRKLHNRWTEERLLQFLRDPASFKQADVRLRRISERYRTDMPSPFVGDDASLKTLIAYLLAE
jgi:cytochrome c2